MQKKSLPLRNTQIKYCRFTVVCIFLLTTVQVFAADTFQLNIPQQNLSSALIELALKAGVSIVFNKQITEGETANALHGVYTLEEALKNILKKTNLIHHYINAQTISISPTCHNKLNCKNQPYQDRSPTQNQQKSATESYIDEVIAIGKSITGSRINRTDIAGSAPVDILNRGDLEASGSQSVVNILKYLPSVAGNSTSTFVTNGGDGTASITLRGLPKGNTLILINGRRIVSGGIKGESIDLNMLPISAIERIEVLKDGASSIYGSDAIAGVVNIILKKHYEGIETEAFYGASSRDDLRTQTINASFGYAFENSNLFINTNIFDQGEIFSRDRSLSATADGRSRGGIDFRSSATPNARITLDSNFYILDTQTDGTPFQGTDPSHYRFATENDLYNFREQTHAFLPTDQESIFITGDYEITPSLQGYLEITYSESTIHNQLAPTPLFTGFEDIDLTISANNIYNPFNQDITDIRRRLIEIGPRVDIYNYDMQSVVVGVESQRNQWAWNLTYGQSISHTNEINTGILSAERTQRALGNSANCLGFNIDNCEPLNLFGPVNSITSEQIQYILTQTESNGTNKLKNLSANLVGTIGYLPAGDIKIAAGLEYRQESTAQHPDRQKAEANTIGGLNLKSSNGQRSIQELYCELLLPLAQNTDFSKPLELELSTRYSRYSDFEQTTNPKLGIRYYPYHPLLIRATYSEGFRAPALHELFASEQQSFNLIADPCANPASVGVLPGCNLLADSSRTQILTITGGNKSLLAEQAQSYTLGLVWDPKAAQHFSFALDLYHIKQKNVVDSSAQFIVNQNATQGDFSELVIRDSNGSITKIIATNLNIGIREITGADLSLNYEQPDTRYGTFKVSLNAAHINRFLDQIDPTAPRENLAGQFSDAASEGNGSLPKWKSNLGFSLSQDYWDIHYTVHYISALTETVPRINTIRRIASWTVHDIQFSKFIAYNLDSRITVGIDNLFDQSPPFVASAFNDNFDSRVYDLTGRFLYLRLKKEF